MDKQVLFLDHGIFQIGNYFRPKKKIKKLALKPMLLKMQQARLRPFKIIQQVILLLSVRGLKNLNLP